MTSVSSRTIDADDERPTPPGPAGLSPTRWRGRLVGAAEVAGLYVVSVVVALVASAALVEATGGSWSEVFSALLDGSVRNPGRVGTTVSTAIPLLIVAVGTIVSSRAGLVNIGQEGQLFVGAAVATYVGVELGGPGPVVIVALLVAGVVGGAAWAGVAALLRAWRGVPEVLTTLLLVTVAFQLVGYGLKNQSLLLAPAEGRANRQQVSEQLASDRRLPRVDLLGNEVPVSVVLALVLAVLVGAVLARTVWGFRLRMLGRNPRVRPAGRGVRGRLRQRGPPRLGGHGRTGRGRHAGRRRLRQLHAGARLPGQHRLDRSARGPGGETAGLGRHRGGARVRRTAHRVGISGRHRRRAPHHRRGAGPPGAGPADSAGAAVPAPAAAGPGRHPGPGVMGFLSALADVATSEAAWMNAVTFAVFLAFGATGEWVAERSGTLNISLEAMFLAGAFGAVVGADLSGRLEVGLAVAVAAGVSVAVVQAQMSHRLIADQFVVGLTLNILVLGLASFLDSEIAPSTTRAGDLRVPLLADIPLAGEALFDRSWLFYLVYPLVPACAWLVHRTRWGLEVRAAGENPQSADVSGIDVNRRRRQSIYVAGACAGAGGAYLALAAVGRFEDSLVGGRGFIAIAAVIFGGWTLRGTLAGCLLFGVALSFRLSLPALGYDVDGDLLSSLPFVLTILVMAAFAGRVRAPTALAQPFVRGLR